VKRSVADELLRKFSWERFARPSEQETPPVGRRGSPTNGLNFSGDTQDMPQVAEAVKAAAPITPFIPVDRAALDVEIKEGRLQITPAVARRILLENNYERQRKVRDAHVAFLADEMRRGSFSPGSQLAFARYAGKLILTNGQHRLNAQVESAETVEYQIIIHDAANAADIHRHYYRQDRGGRARSDSEVLASIGVAARYGLSTTMARSVFQAQPLIANKFVRPSMISDPTLRNDDLRIQNCKPWWPLAATYQGLISVAPASIRKRLTNSQALAVALLTLKYQPARAALFWAGIAQDDGLRRDDPRKALLIDLGSREWGRKSSDGSVSTSVAWNAFFEDRPLKLVKVYADYAIRIAGTPFDGRKS
jgi:hypothetical protein